MKKAKANKIKTKFGIKTEDEMAKTRFSKTTNRGQSTETQAIHLKGKLLQTKQDFQGQGQKALQRAQKESHHYPETSLTRRGRTSQRLQQIFKNQEQFPEWLSEGVTFLIPKTDDTENPKSYWPISCSTAMYKVLTSIITERANIFLESNSLLHKV